MATYVHTLPALTTSLFWQKRGSGSSNAVAFSNAEAACASVTAWFPPTIRLLLDLLQLPQNWDSYGAVRVQERIVRQALMVLVEVVDNDAPAPSVVPLGNGGLQVEWHRRGRNLEIEFPADEAPSFYYYEDGSELESEGQVSKSYDRIQAYIADLK